MSALLLQPHSDDAILFATFTLLRYRPHVVTVLRSELQERRGTGITDHERQSEDEEAFRLLGVTHECLDTTDALPDWEYVLAMLLAIDEDDPPDLVFAPAIEDGGHEQHNVVGKIARQVFDGRVTHYLTYRNGRERSTGEPVLFEPEWPVLKLQALACYRSQIREPSTGHHFLACQLEYLQAP